MASKDATFRAASLGSMLTMNVRVTGMRVFRWRWKLATLLMMLAARVAGCGLQIDLNRDEA